MRLRSIVQSMGLRKNISFLPAYWIAPVAAILLSEPVCAEEPEITPCHRRGTSLVVLTQERRLYLCDDGKIAGDFSARIASSGVGKTKQGDQSRSTFCRRLVPKRSNDTSSPRPPSALRKGRNYLVVR